MIRSLQLKSTSVVTSHSVCISGSWCTIVFHSILCIVCERNFCTWLVTNKFLQCKRATEPNTTLDSVESPLLRHFSFFPMKKKHHQHHHQHQPLTEDKDIHGTSLIMFNGKGLTQSFSSQFTECLINNLTSPHKLLHYFHKYFRCSLENLIDRGLTKISLRGHNLLSFRNQAT